MNGKNKRESRGREKREARGSEKREEEKRKIMV
jgi:hypothetical protein